MDESRGQFTFYRSFWDAVSGLPKKDRLPILEAIISYALDGTEPTGLSMSQSAFFLLCRPTLDSSRKKAASGKQGGSKPKANGKQTEREKEKEKEREKEKEKEYECKGKQNAFDLFWKAYPRKVNKAGAQKAFDKVTVSVDVILKALENHKRSAQWTKDGGAFIPHPTTWLNQRRWEETLPGDPSVPKGASGTLGEAELAAIRRVMQEEV